MQRRAALAVVALLAAGAGHSAGLVETIARVKPGVVLVGTYAEADNPRFQFRGSGFAVADGRSVVTAAHVLPDPTQPVPREARGTERRLVLMAWQGGSRWVPREVELASVARSSDLAVLRLQGGEPLPPLALGARELVAEGSEIALMGFPIGAVLGFSHVTHRGTVSALTQLVPPQSGSRQLSAAAIRQLRDGGIDIYQLDALAYPGNSGGPVFDPASGQVIGVLSMGLTRAGREGALGAPTGISYAIPVQQLHELLAR